MEKIKKFLFVNTSNKQTIIKNTFWLFVGEIGVRLLKLVVFVYAARKLGASEWGVFSYVLALMSMFAIISDIGVNSVIQREVAKKGKDIQKYISTSFFIKIGLSFIASLALFSILLFTKESNPIKILIPITAIILFFDSIREFGFSINRAFEKMEVEAFTKIIATVLLIILSYIFISQNPKSISLSYAYLISGILGVLIMYLTLKKHFKKTLSNYNPKLIMIIIKEAFPIAIVSVIGTITSNIDMIILGWFTDSQHIGLYSAAQKPIQIIYLIPSLLSTAIFPLFSRLANNDQNKAKSVIKKSLRFSLFIAILINLVVFLIGGTIFKLIFGYQYIESIPIFKIMSLAIITGAPGIIMSNALFALGQQKKLIKYIILTLITNLFLCLILVPRFNILGAAIAVTLSQTIGSLFLIIKSRGIFK